MKTYRLVYKAKTRTGRGERFILAEDRQQAWKLAIDIAGKKIISFDMMTENGNLAFPD